MKEEIAEERERKRVAMEKERAALAKQRTDPPVDQSKGCAASEDAEVEEPRAMMAAGAPSMSENTDAAATKADSMLSPGLDASTRTRCLASM